MTSNDYPYIRAWGRMLGSDSYYIDRQVAQARTDGAPPNAVYRNANGQWQTTDDVVLADSRIALGLDPLPLRPIDAAQLAQHLHGTIAAWGPLRYLYGLNAIELLPRNAGLRLTFSTGYTAELRLTVQRPDSTTSAT